MEEKELQFTFGIECEYNNQVTAFPNLKHWDCKNDAGELELVTKTPIATQAKLISTLDELGSISNNLTLNSSRTYGRGLHIHVGVKNIRDLSGRPRLARTLLNLETALINLANPQDNRLNYCLPWSPLEKEKVKKRAIFTSECRYRWCNLAAYDKHGTAEFRIFNSTKDAEVVKHWVYLIHCVFEAAVFGKLKLDWEGDTQTPEKTQAKFELIFDACADSNIKQKAREFFYSLLSSAKFGSASPYTKALNLHRPEVRVVSTTQVTGSARVEDPVDPATILQHATPDEDFEAGPEVATPTPIPEPTPRRSARNRGFPTLQWAVNPNAGQNFSSSSTGVETVSVSV